MNNAPPIHVLLINPPITGKNPEELQMREPLGLAYLAGVLIENHHNVSILDFYALGGDEIRQEENRFRRGLSDKEIFQYLDKINPDIIGITCNFTIFSNDSFNVAKLCKAKYPDKIIVLGGAHASAMTDDDLRENEYIDIIVRGEGENILLDIVENYKKNKNFENIKGTLLKRGSKIIINSSRDLIADIDSIPMPKRELLDMDFYLRNSNIFGHVKKIPAAVIITSRGCPFNCIFCSVKNMFNRIWRSHSAARVIEEMKILRNIYGVREIFIYDDNFIIDRRRVMEICKNILAEKLDLIITLPSGMPVNLIDNDLLKTLMKAGLYRVNFPIESGSMKTLNFIGKDINLIRTKEIIKSANRLGLWTSGHFIIGFPYETADDIKKTVDYAESSGLDFVSYFIAQPYAGSNLCEIFRKENLLTNNKINQDSRATETKYNTKYFTAKELQCLRDKFASRYLICRILNYFNPFEFILYLYPKINSAGKLMYFWKLLNNVTFMKIMLNKRKF